MANGSGSAHGPALVRWVNVVGALVVFCGVDAGSGAAQEALETGTRAARAGVSVGPSAYDLSGTGTGFAGAARFGVTVAGPLEADIGIGYFRYDTQFGTGVSMLLPEVSLMLARRGARIQPYVGAGLGGAFTIQGPSDDDLTLHAVVGFDVPVSGVWRIGAEARQRVVDPWVGSQLELNLTLSRVLKR